MASGQSRRGSREKRKGTGGFGLFSFFFNLNISTNTNKARESYNHFYVISLLCLCLSVCEHRLCQAAVTNNFRISLVSYNQSLFFIESWPGSPGYF